MNDILTQILSLQRKVGAHQELDVLYAFQPPTHWVAQQDWHCKPKKRN